MSVQVIHADARLAVELMADASVDSVVTDPPYALVSIGKRFGSPTAAPARGDVYARASRGFMGKQWDNGEVAFDPAFWVEVLRVLKPGGHVLAFGGTRTYHRLACAIEDAGFEIRDQVGWLYGTGFPKSHDVSKGIDKAAGAEREVVGSKLGLPGYSAKPNDTAAAEAECAITAPATDLARQWEGWGTALKPAWEPIVLARKPLGSPAVDVRSNIERQLYARGFAEITWTLGNVSGAAKPEPRPISSSTAAPPAAATSAARAAENAMVSADAITGNSSEQRGTSGREKTQGVRKNSAAHVIGDSATKSSMPTAVAALAAENPSGSSSHSTTSTAAGPHTENLSTGKFTPNSAGRGSPSAIESFAGIATGLSGSMATVRIDRLADGSFAWPRDLPKVVPAKSLTVAENVAAHGTGAINVDGCRVGEGEYRRSLTGGMGRKANPIYGALARSEVTDTVTTEGRWPANILHDDSDEVIAAFPQSVGQLVDASTRADRRKTQNVYGAMRTGNGRGGEPSADRSYADQGNTNFAMKPGARRGDSGSAARFFYSAKASKADRAGSKHPTIKPVALMRYLCRLITPPGGTVLDPFAGSGTTGQAAREEGFRAVLIEREAEYVADIHRRLGTAPVAASAAIDDPERLFA